MNYQHAFHAGNFADVHKHAVLVRILQYLARKTSPFRVIDTHAGAGRYDLFGEEASRSGEWRDGIARVFEAQQENPQSLLAPYLEVVAAFNPPGELRVYPGSPLIACRALRAQDRLIACEAEPRAAMALQAALHHDRRAKVLSLDGWMALNANVPPKERRGIVLIDPPFEEAADFTRLPAALAQAHGKWPTGIYMLWYPIKDRGGPDALARGLSRVGMPKILRSELVLARPRSQGGLLGSGLIIVNPPFTLADELRAMLPALARIFSAEAGVRIDWLAAQPARAASDRRGPHSA
jgi:23S rRNA (adenine2030-N6)-methyltransferase